MLKKNFRLTSLKFGFLHFDEVMLYSGGDFYQIKRGLIYSAINMFIPPPPLQIGRKVCWRKMQSIINALQKQG